MSLLLVHDDDVVGKQRTSSENDENDCDFCHDILFEFCAIAFFWWRHFLACVIIQAHIASSSKQWTQNTAPYPLLVRNRLSGKQKFVHDAGIMALLWIGGIMSSCRVVLISCDIVFSIDMSCCNDANGAFSHAFSKCLESTSTLLQEHLKVLKREKWH